MTNNCSFYYFYSHGSMHPLRTGSRPLTPSTLLSTLLSLSNKRTFPIVSFLLSTLPCWVTMPVFRLAFCNGSFPLTSYKNTLSRLGVQWRKRYDDRMRTQRQRRGHTWKTICSINLCYPIGDLYQCPCIRKVIKYEERRKLAVRKSLDFSPLSRSRLAILAVITLILRSCSRRTSKVMRKVFYKRHACKVQRAKAKKCMLAIKKVELTLTESLLQSFQTYDDNDIS